MNPFTVFLIKDGFKIIERYSIVKEKVLEDQNSIFNSGIILRRNQKIESFILNQNKEVKEIKRAKSFNIVYYRNTDNKRPWWKDFWTITDQLENKSTDVIVLISIGKRLFVVAHGHGRWILNPLSIEHDFGLKVALNLIDNGKIKSTGLFSPSEIGMKTKKYSGIETDLKSYEINVFNSLLKDLSGSVEEQFEKYFKKIDGADNIKFQYSEDAGKLKSVLKDLLLIYKKNDYRNKGFEWVDYFKTVRDPHKIEELNSHLLEKILEDPSEILLAFPGRIENLVNPCFKFSGLGKRKSNEGIFHSLDIKIYIDKLSKTRDISLKDIESDQIILLDENNFREISSYSIFQCLYSEEVIGSDTFFLEAGVWYKFDKDFLNNIEARLSTKLWPTNFIDYRLSEISKTAKDNKKTKEYVYNEVLAAHFSQVGISQLLDSDLVIYNKEKIELCDVIFKDKSDRTFLIHNKYRHSSSALSHLFSQGTVSASLLSDVEFRKISNQKISETPLKFSENANHDRNQYSIVYGIISKRNKRNVFHLPLFSKVNLDLAIRNLGVLGYNAFYGHIEVV